MNRLHVTKHLTWLRKKDIILQVISFYSYLEGIAMKKIRVFLVIVACFFTLISQESWAMELENAVKDTSLRYSSQGIADDEMAKAIKCPKPYAIKEEVLNKIDEGIRRGISLQNITEIDFSDNFITGIGAAQIFRFLYIYKEEFKNLAVLSLSLNRISEDDSYELFKEELANALITLPSLQKINLKGNYLTAKSLLQGIQIEFVKRDIKEDFLLIANKISI